MRKEVREKIERKIRRTKRVRNKILLSDSNRLSVFRSNKYIYAQIIDDSKGKTIVSAYEKEVKEKASSKLQKALELGKLIAKKANAKKIKNVVFDKGPYSYHGRVKAFADGAREGGLTF